MRIAFITIILLSSIRSLSAQNTTPQVLNATGNTTFLKTMTISWSVGEENIATLSASNMVLTQGFLQPDVNPHYSGIESISVSDDISVFPNPAHNTLVIKESNENIELVSVTNVLGQRVLFKKFDNSPLDISMLNPGIYYVNISGYNQQINHTFKIIKY
jgi:hypothetical protein